MGDSTTKPKVHSSSFDHLQTLSGEARIKAVLEQWIEMGKDGDFMAHFLPHIDLLEVTYLPSEPPTTFRVVLGFTVQPGHCNVVGNMHGGATATLFDGCTSLPLALAARPGYWMLMGVSRCLNVTYLRPIPMGARVRIDCEIVALGRTLCSLRGTIRKGEEPGGAVLAVCDHQKFDADIPLKI